MVLNFCWKTILFSCKTHNMVLEIDKINWVKYTAEYSSGCKIYIQRYKAAAKPLT